MADYMEFPAITATTTEGKIQQLTDYLIKFQEKYNHLVEEIQKKGD
jgi:hypothetical protein